MDARVVHFADFDADIANFSLNIVSDQFADDIRSLRRSELAFWTNIGLPNPIEVTADGEVKKL